MRKLINKFSPMFPDDELELYKTYAIEHFHNSAEEDDTYEGLVRKERQYMVEGEAFMYFGSTPTTPADYLFTFGYAEGENGMDQVYESVDWKYLNQETVVEKLIELKLLNQI